MDDERRTARSGQRTTEQQQAAATTTSGAIDPSSLPTTIVGPKSSVYTGDVRYHPTCSSRSATAPRFHRNTPNQEQSLHNGPPALSPSVLHQGICAAPQWNRVGSSWEDANRVPLVPEQPQVSPSAIGSHLDHLLFVLASIELTGRPARHRAPAASSARARGGDRGNTGSPLPCCPVRKT